MTNIKIVIETVFSRSVEFGVLFFLLGEYRFFARSDSVKIYFRLLNFALLSMV